MSRARQSRLMAIRLRAEDIEELLQGCEAPLETATARWVWWRIRPTCVAALPPQDGHVHVMDRRAH